MRRSHLGRWLLVVLAPLLASSCLDIGQTPSLSSAGAKSAPNAVSPHFSPDGSRVVFSSDHEGNDEIYWVAADGTGTPHRLTHDAANDLDPTYAPDGRIFFDSYRDGPPHLYVMDGDGSHLQRITDEQGRGDIFPAVSSDGSQLAFACGPSLDGLDLCVSNIDGSMIRNLTNSPAVQDWEPTWSPDGTRIAFGSNRYDGYDIYSVDVATAALSRLTDSPGRDSDPAWSPDGSWIAFDSDRTGTPALYTISPRGGTGQLMPAGTTADGAVQPSWSPDGDHVVFYGPAGDRSRLYVLDLRDGGITPLTG